MNAVPVQGGLSRRVFRVLWWLFAILLVLVSAGFIFDSAVVAYFRWQYPYGWSHCCLLGLRGSLEEYAKRHDGHFPAGAGCPEASLSLLYREGLTDANTLRGKTVPEKVVKDILERGELLGPDTCGWHYVEGLTLADDFGLAIVWDKVGLGHNGQDLKGGHSVSYLGSWQEIVPASEWPKFLETQAQLMAKRSENAKKGRPVLIAKIRLPSGEVQVVPRSVKPTPKNK